MISKSSKVKKQILLLSKKEIDRYNSVSPSKIQQYVKGISLRDAAYEALLKLNYGSLKDFIKEHITKITKK